MNPHGTDPTSEGPPLERLRRSLGDDFDVLDEVGHGSMAIVYLARERALGRLVAVKVLKPGRAGDETARKRFEREARSAASLSHPGVVPVYRFGELDDGTPYLVMRYVKGRTMEDRLAAEGRLPLPVVREVLRDVAAALAVAHKRGIVHRDVRPANVLWDEDEGRALLSDFGIAAVMATGDADAQKLTRAGQVVGQLQYLSPEQLGDGSITTAADLYSFGILGYELCAGEGPYAARTPTEWVTAHMAGTPRDLAALRPDADPELADLLLRCLNKQPTHRPAAADVARILGGRADPGAAGSRNVSPTDDPLGEIVRRRVPAIVLSAVVVGAGLIAFVDNIDDLLPPSAKPLSIVFSAAGVLASAVIAWFHGERGRQAAPFLEYLLLALVAVAWLAISAWVLLTL
ncbi:MAG: serine/threonine protein kinase [Gemmatimonadota bacterium]|nr:serine/threonine protein kinase [Gemmatimonadota bacterium]MDH5761120.1 serine/threonine protein kinase [Gemmatimonadota bacterium]